MFCQAQFPQQPKLILQHFSFPFQPPCSKCRTLKTSSRTVSVQVQLVSYKCQPGHKLFSDQCQTNGHDLIGSECQYRYKRSYQTSSYSINAKSQGTISSALNFTQGHKPAIKQALIDQCQISRHNLISSKCHTGTQE